MKNKYIKRDNATITKREKVLNDKKHFNFVEEYTIKDLTITNFDLSNVNNEKLNSTELYEITIKNLIPKQQYKINLEMHNGHKIGFFIIKFNKVYKLKNSNEIKDNFPHDLILQVGYQINQKVQFFLDFISLNISDESQLENYEYLPYFHKRITISEDGLLFNSNHVDINVFYDLSYHIKDSEIYIEYDETLIQGFMSLITSNHIEDFQIYFKNQIPIYKEIILEGNLRTTYLLNYSKQNFEYTQFKFNANVIFFEQNKNDIVENIYFFIEKYSEDLFSFFQKDIYNDTFIIDIIKFKFICLKDINNKLNYTLNEKSSIESLYLFNISFISLFNLVSIKLKAEKCGFVSIYDSIIYNMNMKAVTDYDFHNLLFQNARINQNPYFCKINTLSSENQIIEDEQFIKFINNKIENLHIFERTKIINMYCKNIPQINIELNLDYKQRIIILEQFFEKFIESPFYIKIEKFKETQPILLPLKESGIKNFLPYLIDLHLLDIYQNINKNLVNNIKYKNSLTFVENELRISKHIQLANEFAILCEKLEFWKQNQLVDIFWGSSFLYEFGYTKKPFKKFILWYLFLFLGFFSIYLGLKSLYSHYNISYLDVFNTNNLYDYVTNIALPTFKIEKTPRAIQCLIIVCNIFETLNLVGLGITLKRRYSRNSS